MKQIAVIALILLISSPALAQSPATVLSIGDGDTITINQNGNKVKVRLGCIDAPEMKQTPYGEAARDKLKSLLPVGTSLTLREIDRDRYGRTVGEIFKGNQSINLAMVASGQAVIYPQYFKGCQGSQGQYNQAQNQAKQKKLGLWNQNNPVMPWNFRKGQKTDSPKPTSQPVSSKNCDPSYPDLCISPNSSDLDCKDITARRFQVLPPDPHKLDRDRDGIGCEK